MFLADKFRNYLLNYNTDSQYQHPAPPDPRQNTQIRNPPYQHLTHTNNISIYVKKTKTHVSKFHLFSIYTPKNLLFS